jgi:hypothetical protein
MMVAQDLVNLVMVILTMIMTDDPDTLTHLMIMNGNVNVTMNGNVSDRYRDRDRDRDHDHDSYREHTSEKSKDRSRSDKTPAPQEILSKLKRETYTDGAELINTKEQIAIAPLTTPIQEVAQGRELVLAGSSYSQRIFHLSEDGFVPIYLWDLLTFTANSFPEFYSYVPSRSSGLELKMVLLVPVGFLEYHTRSRQRRVECPLTHLRSSHKW